MNIKKSVFSLSTILIFSLPVSAEVKFANQTDMAANSTPNADAMIEVESDSKGILLPRVALVSEDSPSPLGAHVAGMEVYNTTQNGSVFPCVYHNTGTKWVSECDTEWYESGGVNTSSNSKNSAIYRQANIGINEITSDTDFEVSEEVEIKSLNPTILLNDGNGLAYNTGIYMSDSYKAVFGISSDTASAAYNLTFANYRPYSDPALYGGFKWWSSKPEHTDWIMLNDNGSSDIITNSIDITRMETIMHLTADGDLHIDGTLTQNSDVRLKKNMEPIVNAIADLNKIEPITYEWKIDAKNVNGREIGFKAQNIEAVFPELVSTEASTGIKSVAYANITPILVKAVQELNTKFEQDQLEQIERIQKLEKENKELKLKLEMAEANSLNAQFTQVELNQLKKLLKNSN